MSTAAAAVDTEIDATNPTTTTNQPTTTMPPPRIPLTLIVAATPSLGIGHAGTLPWPQLKKEMAYFARVTKRVPPPPPPSSSSSTTATTPPRHNAVIMGRKTWESIPPRFRPLKDRINVIVSRSGFVPPPSTAEEKAPQTLAATSLPDALAQLAEVDERGALGRVYVIGGAQLYGAALGMGEVARWVLLTRVWREYECDTVFPVDVLGEGEGWVRRGNGELGRFVGEEVGEGRVVGEGGVEFEFCLFERVGGGEESK